MLAVVGSLTQEFAESAGSVAPDEECGGKYLVDVSAR